jgi:ABC-2 type transport system permease protein
MPVFDQGYQHWSGTLSGYAWRWLTITRHGVRVGMQNPFLRILVIASWLPAIGLAFMLSLWGLLENKSPLVTSLMPLLAKFFWPGQIADPIRFRVEVWTLCYNVFLQIELYFSMIVILLVGPALISQDLRYNALPLYFSRSLRRIDYFVGKLGVIGWFLGTVVILPSLIAYVLGLLFSLDITIVRDTWPLLLACLAYGAVIVVSAGTLILALSSLSRNSRYIALFWVALWFVTAIVANILNEVNSQQRGFAQRQMQAAVNPFQQEFGKKMTPEQQAALQRAMMEWAKKMRDDSEAEELHAAQTNWRPLVSYTGNLSRIREQLLGTDTVWEELSKLEPAEARHSFLMRNLGPQYPWHWSAGILAALFGLSTWILHFRVRSLDRLR